MMNLFRRKRPAAEPPEVTRPVEAAAASPAAPPEPPAAATTATTATAAVPPAPDYESWSPAGPAAPLSATGGELAPQLVEAAPETADTLPTPPGVDPDHPLAGQIARALSSVYDPEIPVDIYQLGLVYGVALNEANDARISMTLTTPGCPVAGSMPSMVEYAVASMVDGIGDVEVELVWDPPWNPDRMSEAAQLELGFM